jgi:ferredoxin
MSVRIAENCVRCGACLFECPTGAISPGAARPVVDREKCTECYGFFGESQCIVVCPEDAIVVEQEPLELLSAKYAGHYPQRQPQDIWIWQRLGRTVS